MVYQRFHMIMNKLKELLGRRWVRFAALAVSGLLTGCTVCFPTVGILEWISLIPAALVIFSLADDKRNRLRSIYLYGLFFFSCYFAVVWHWLFVLYPLSNTGLPELAALGILTFGVVFIAALQSASFALLFVLTAKLMRGSFAGYKAILGPIAAAALWTLLEWSQTFFWFGIPWGRLSIGQTEVLVTIQSASVFGCYFVSFLLVAVNFSLAMLIYSNNKKKSLAITAAALFSINAVFGVLLITFGEAVPQKTVKAAVIQGNISSVDKWGVDWFDVSSEVYGRLTREAANGGASLVIWPESVLPTYIETAGYCRSFISELADECNVTILVGTLSERDGRQYNTIVTVSPDGSISKNMYDKQKLVPFGEYVPWRSFLTAVFPPLEDINMLSSDLTAGNASKAFETEQGIVGPAICFDSIFEETVRRSARNGAEILAVETNDSWFWDSAAIYMHLAQSKLRAVENRKYVLRAANTGVSAIIDPFGRVICETAALTEGYSIAEIGLMPELTPYTLWGNVFVGLSGSFVTALLFADMIIGIKKRRMKVSK